LWNFDGSAVVTYASEPTTTFCCALAAKASPQATPRHTNELVFTLLPFTLLLVARRLARHELASLSLQAGVLQPGR
jgi:hypothetical protein